MTWRFDLFVVHAATDADFVRGFLVPALNLPPSRVLLVDDLTPGAYLVSEIARAVTSSRFTVAVLSPACLEDRWAAFGEQLASHVSVEDVHVIPLVLTPCELPLQLQARVALDFTDRAGWEVQAERLRTLLHTAASATEQIACPYPGMRPFGFDEASRFFGRDKEIDELIGRLDCGEQEIYVIGPSGSGKSSLVQAGLWHALDTGASRVGRSFVVRSMRPGERPADRLAEALEGDPATPAATVDALVARHPPAERVLVFVDQLEELFALTGAAERRRFVAILRALRAEARCHLLLALRSDFYGALMDSELGPELAGRMSPLTVAPLRGAALAQAITEPAARAGVHLEARLCDRLVADAAGEPGALPHVQETLRLLWDKRRQRLLGLAEYEALGDGGSGLHLAIARRADATMRALTVGQQTIARRVLLRLVSFGEGRADTRRQQAAQDLTSAADDAAEFSGVLQRLVADRLVTIDGGGRAGGAVADLAHEALITAWPELGRQIAQRQVDEQRRRRLEGKVGEWIERGRGAAGLLDPVELSFAEQWRQSDAARELGYGAGLPALVAASRAEIDKAQRLVGMTYLEQGRALLLDGHPMAAVPYLVAARTERIEGRVLRMLFAQAARSLPLVSFVGHHSTVSVAAWSPDGTRVVTASRDNTARIWDAATGLPVSPPLQHRDMVSAAAFGPDGTRVVTASLDKTARVWDVATGRPVTPPLEHRDVVEAAAFSPSGSRVVTASRDHTAQVWDASTGRRITPPFQHQDVVEAAAWSPDGTRVITASHDQTARIWSASTGAPVTPPLGHRDVVRMAAWSADGTRVITASGDHTARVWDAAAGTAVTRPLEHRGPVYVAAWSADGTRVVTAGCDRMAWIWDAATGKPVTPPLLHHNAIHVAAFCPDGTRVVTASRDRTARVWDAATGKPVTPPLEHQSFVHAAAFCPDGTRVVTASRDMTARIWRATAELPVTPPLAHRDVVLGAAFCPRGHRVVTASSDHTARVWDAATGTPVTPPLEHQDVVYAAAFSPDGTRVVTASRDKTARVWDAATGRPLGPPLPHQAVVHAAGWSPDGTRVVTASWDATARVWDAATGMPVIPLRHQSAVWAAAFCPDGTRVVTASRDKTARVWDAATGAPVTPPLPHRSFVHTAAFSRDGTRVVTASSGRACASTLANGTPVNLPVLRGDVGSLAPPGSAPVAPASSDRTARVWNAATGTPVTPPLEHQGSVYAAAFSPDGTYVVTASRDHTARIWDAATGTPVTPPLEHQGAVNTAAFCPDGTRVVTASDDQTARVWDATTGTPVTLPLEHHGPVRVAAWSPDGTRVVTAGFDHAARIWTLPLHAGSLEDWRLLARGSPFALVNGVLTTNPDPLRVLGEGDRRAADAARDRSAPVARDGGHGLRALEITPRSGRPLAPRDQLSRKP